MEIESLSVTLLGTGTSQGIPMIACECEVCQSEDARDNRLRCSVLLTINGLNYVIDAGPDFRTQLLREKVKSLEGVIFTHEHKDHIAGLDDVRPFNYLHNKDIDIYCNELVEIALKREFHYAFSGDNYPGIPKFNLIPISKEKTFQLKEGFSIQPIEVLHYKLPVLGFRIKDFTYITDCKTIAKEELEKIKGTKVLVLNCLREEEHISHLNLEEALALIAEVKPEKTYLTHISHLFGKHEEIEMKLPDNVFVAYDGLKLLFD